VNKQHASGSGIQTSQAQLSEIDLPSNNAVAEATNEEQIRELAYALYKQRGRVDGDDLQDWLRTAESIFVRDGNPPLSG
jgi:Protein of unknown function (DUF2934)